MYCLSSAFVPIQLLYSSVVVAHNRGEAYFISIFIYATIQILAAFLILPYGIYWMAFTIVLTNLLYYLSWHFLTRICILIRLWDVIKDIAPYLVITLFIFSIVYLITMNINNIYWSLVAKIGLSILLYIGTMKVTKSTYISRIVSVYKRR